MADEPGATPTTEEEVRPAWVDDLIESQQAQAQAITGALEPLAAFLGSPEEPEPSPAAAPPAEPQPVEIVADVAAGLSSRLEAVERELGLRQQAQPEEPDPEPEQPEEPEPDPEPESKVPRGLRWLLG